MNEVMKAILGAGKALMSWNPTANQLYGFVLLNLLAATAGIVITNQNVPQTQVFMNDDAQNKATSAVFEEECAEISDEQ